MARVCTVQTNTTVLNTIYSSQFTHHMFRLSWAIIRYKSCEKKCSKSRKTQRNDAARKLCSISGFPKHRHPSKAVFTVTVSAPVTWPRDYVVVDMTTDADIIYFAQNGSLNKNLNCGIHFVPCPVVSCIFIGCHVINTTLANCVIIKSRRTVDGKEGTVWGFISRIYYCKVIHVT
jgi:hypothetical protein